MTPIEKPTRVADNTAKACAVIKETLESAAPNPVTTGILFERVHKVTGHNSTSRINTYIKFLRENGMRIDTI